MAMRRDFLRLHARVIRKGERDVMPSSRRLHLGCGSRLVSGWLNVDVSHSDYDVDLACGSLPWRSGVFDTIVSEHFIEHLELDDELMCLLPELHRVLRPGGEIWLSCPDMEKVCTSYLYRGMEDLFEDRRIRWPNYSLESVPTVHMLNDLFHQGGEHKNLYDFTLLSWALRISSFIDVARANESDLLRRFPTFPVRGDDAQSLYVRAVSAPG